MCHYRKSDVSRLMSVKCHKRKSDVSRLMSEKYHELPSSNSSTKGNFAPLQTLELPSVGVCCTPDNHRQLKGDFLPNPDIGEMRFAGIGLTDNQ